jgi:two-component system sensor kinase FixL
MEKVYPPLASMGQGMLPLAGLWRHAGARVAVFFLAYVVLDKLTYVFPARFGITPFNPEAAIAVALLIICGKRFIPLLLLAALWGEYSLPPTQRPWSAIVFNGALLTASYALMAHLLSGRFRVSLDMDTRRDVLRLMAVTLSCMLLCGIVYVGLLVAHGVGGEARYFNGARRFFIGYSVGMLVAAPLVLMLFSAKRRVRFAQMLHSREAWLQAAVMLACIGWVFLQDTQEHVRFFYVLFMPVIWSAARFGMVGASSALALIQSGVYGVMYFTGYQPQSVFELQLLLIALAITGLLLGVTIDEQQRAAADFRESLRLAAAGEMAAAITHEINQPLTAMSGYATAGQLLAAAPVLDRACLDDAMGRLVEESRRTAAVVRRLRDFFRSGATRLERHALADIAARVTAALQPRAQAAGISLTCTAQDTLAPVLVDDVQLEVVLRNLLINALDSAAAAQAGTAAASGKGSVTVSLAVNKAGMQQMEVRDSGAGIGAADVERIFEAFVTTKTNGMGIGLAICRAIVEAHGGALWAVPGTGGLLCLTLPQDGLAPASP